MNTSDSREETLLDAQEEARVWRSIADDLYAELRQHEHPIPQSVINALIRYERQQQGRH